MDAQQYLEEIPVLAKYKMNFLMNCYLSMFDDRTGKNEWWLPLPDGEEAGLRGDGPCLSEARHPVLLLHESQLGSKRIRSSDPHKISTISGSTTPGCSRWA